jgi:hypothetical protein
LIFQHISPLGRVLNVQHGIGFRPLRAKDFAAGATALNSCGRIGTNGASGSATNENDPFCGGFSGFGQAERAAEPPRGPRIESPAPLPNRPRLCGPPAALHFPPPVLDLKKSVLNRPFCANSAIRPDSPSARRTSLDAMPL